MTDTPPPSPEPRRLRRARDDRVVGGVCAGVARYFDIDPLLVRVGAVALAALGGAGVLLYLAALLLVPEDGAAGPVAPPRGRLLTILGVVLLVSAVGALLPDEPGYAWPFGLVLAAALAAALIVGARRAEGDGRDVAARLTRAALVGLACLVLFLGGALLAGTGHATLAAVLVIVVGAGLALLGALGRGGGEPILPALALALPVAAVSAAGIDLRGGTGDRMEHPATPAQVRPEYRLGAGRLVVDLRDARLPAGDLPLRMRVGLGEAVLLVPGDVCVATRARVGAGRAAAFDRASGGIDVDWRDEPPAPADRARVVLDADVGLGQVAVAHTLDGAERNGWGDQGRSAEANTGCGRGDVARG